jgi:hypothetical protein
MSDISTYVYLGRDDTLARFNTGSLVIRDSKGFLGSLIGIDVTSLQQAIVLKNYALEIYRREEKKWKASKQQTQS